MNQAPFLTWLENWAMWILWRSPRVGMMSIKQIDSPMVWYFESENDRCPINPFVPPDEYDGEPNSMMLERLYHMPAHGEFE